MTKTEKQEIIDRIKAMDSEEIENVVKAIPSELLVKEIGRREKIKTEMINKIKDIIKIKDD